MTGGCCWLDAEEAKAGALWDRDAKENGIAGVESDAAALDARAVCANAAVESRRTAQLNAVKIRNSAPNRKASRNKFPPRDEKYELSWRKSVSLTPPRRACLATFRSLEHPGARKITKAQNHNTPAKSSRLRLSVPIHAEKASDFAAFAPLTAHAMLRCESGLYLRNCRRRKTFSNGKLSFKRRAESPKGSDGPACAASKGGRLRWAALDA